VCVFTLTLGKQNIISVVLTNTCERMLANRIINIFLSHQVRKVGIETTKKGYLKICCKKLIIFHFLQNRSILLDTFDHNFENHFQMNIYDNICN